jgi:hypothetical protein
MVKLYIEGGGDGRDLRDKCREAFSCFLLKAGFKGKMPRLVSCGSRKTAFDFFKTSVESGETCLLLIDSEDFITVTSPWEHLLNRKGDEFQKPANATDDHCHLMVVCMESWFFADKVALANYFGQGFTVNSLPKNQNIEQVPKNIIFSSLAQATLNCKTKEPYSKGSHSFDILMTISPDLVKNASPWAKRFLEKLEEFMNK